MSAGFSRVGRVTTNKLFFSVLPLVLSNHSKMQLKLLEYTENGLHHDAVSLHYLQATIRNVLSDLPRHLQSPALASSAAK